MVGTVEIAFWMAVSRHRSGRAQRRNLLSKAPVEIEVANFDTLSATARTRISIAKDGLFVCRRHLAHPARPLPRVALSEREPISYDYGHRS